MGNEYKNRFNVPRQVPARHATVFILPNLTRIVIHKSNPNDVR